MSGARFAHDCGEFVAFVGLAESCDSFVYLKFHVLELLLGEVDFIVEGAIR